MKVKEDLTGVRFEKLTVIRWTEGYWECRCDCGNIKKVKTGHLNSGDVKSCGCLIKTHGFANSKSSKHKSKFYSIWEKLKGRCDNPNDSSYEYYGGRRITYDTRWNDFLEFKNDMYFEYLYALKQKRIEQPVFRRINTNDNYYKNNCYFDRWKLKDDLTGKKINKLKVLRWLNNGYWECECECGGKINVITGHLKHNRKKSCGCLIKNHGFANSQTNKQKKKFYKIWNNLKARCNDSDHKSYHNYGGRGITYDPRWNDFLEFKSDMYFEYLYALKQKGIKDISIERLDFNGNYCKKNCCFIEKNDQNKNTRSIISFVAISPTEETFVSKNVSEFARNHNLNPSHIHDCLNGQAKHHKNWKFRKI